MNNFLRIPLNTTAAQFERLLSLQKVFSQACNQLAPEVSRSRVWNRVALHHLHYRALRDQFPALGSQMVCNAIYAVSKMSRLIYQAAASPYNVSRLPGKLLPLAADCQMHLPAKINDYTDFYVGIEHAQNVGKLFRPDNPLLPNYKYVPIGYHGRASTIRPSGTDVRRPKGQTLPAGQTIEASVPSLDWSQSDAPGVDEEVYVTWSHDAGTVLAS